MLAFLLLGVGYVINQRVEARLQRVYNVEVVAVEVPTGEQAINRGRHLVTSVFFCQECHGEQLQGRIHFNHPLTGRIAAANLTRGQGGVGGRYADEDWVRAIRHGIGSDGKPLIEMPSNFYADIADGDLGAIIAYLRSLPPVDNTLPEESVGPLYRISILGDPSLIPAEVIDHDAPPPPEPVPGVSVEYGRYLAGACTICHGRDFAGGPGAGAGLNLTGGGNLARWSEDDFIRTLRTGVTPRGYELDPELMPWKRIGKMSDDELRAIWMYLQTVSAVSREDS